MVACAIQDSPVTPELPPKNPLQCDTCGRIAKEVKRVVLDGGYNRANVVPLYNCPDCYEAKRREREASNQPQ